MAVPSDLFLNRTRARREFKSILGNANHLTITALVGLHGVREGSVRCPEDFSTSWNPQNVVRSADRSERFVLRGTLTANADALDVYARLLVRAPLVLEDGALIGTVQGLGINRLGLRLKSLWDYLTLDTDGSEIVAMVRFGIAWRNRLVHSTDDSELDPAVRKTLTSRAAIIEKDYQGLSIETMLERFDRGGEHRGPSFKETLGLVRGAHKFVQTVDSRILSNLDPSRYFLDCLRLRFKERPAKITELWSRDSAARPKHVVQLAQEAGFSPERRAEVSQPLTYSSLLEIASWSVAEARAKLRPS